MTDEQKELLSKAEESIAAARLLLNSGFHGIAASRAYYAMFYLATLLLLEKDLRFKTHSGLHGAFATEIARAGKLPTEVHAWLLDASDARHASDYRTNRVISREEAWAHIEHAEKFLQAVRPLLAPP